MTSILEQLRKQDEPEVEESFDRINQGIQSVQIAIDGETSTNEIHTCCHILASIAILEAALLRLDLKTMREARNDIYWFSTELIHSVAEREDLLCVDDIIIRRKPTRTHGDLDELAQDFLNKSEARKRIEKSKAENQKSV